MLFVFDMKKISDNLKTVQESVLIFATVMNSFLYWNEDRSIVISNIAGEKYTIKKMFFEAFWVNAIFEHHVV